MPRRIPTASPPRSGPRTRQDKKERDAVYNRAPWKKLRLAHLEANVLCVECEKEGRITPATHVHHVVERLKDPGRTYDPTNLMSVCARHHTLIHKARDGGRP